MAADKLKVLGGDGAGDNPQETLIEFPCDFPIKVMGEMQDSFAEEMVSAIQTVLPSFDPAQIEMRGSSTGKYISLTCEVYVESKAQLDEVYRVLSKHPLVKYLL